MVTVAKILVIGSSDACKTNIMKHISDEWYSANDVATSENLKQFNEIAGTGIDVGISQIDDEMDMHLYVTREKFHFSFIMQNIIKHVFASILLIDASSEQALNEAKTSLQDYRRMTDMKLVIGVSNHHLPQARSLKEISALLNIKDISMFTVDTFEKKDAEFLILALMKEVFADAADEQGEDVLLDFNTLVYP